MIREMTPEIRRKMAGFMLMDEDCEIPLTPAFLAKEENPPVFYIRPYSVKGLKGIRDGIKNPAGFVSGIVDVFASGEGLLRWEGFVDQRGEDVPYSVDSIRRLITMEGLVLWLNREIMRFTNGPTDEELEGLG